MLTSQSLPLHGRRVVLRRLSTSDLIAFQAYRHDKDVGRYQGWEPWTDHRALAFLESMHSIDLFQPDTWFQVGIADRESGALIGDIGVCVWAEESEAEMGFSLNALWQGRGLAFEAVGLAINFVFESTSVGRIVCITDARNLPANRLLKGLRMEHVRTKEAVFRGEPCQECVFVLSREAPLS